MADPTTAPGRTADGDPFGHDAAARGWRRLAGTTTVVAVPAAVVALIAPDLRVWAALAVVVAVLLGAPASAWVAPRVRKVAAAHAAAGAALGAAFGAWAAVWAPDPGVAVLVALLAVATGATVAVLALRVSLALPAHVVTRVAVAGSVVAVGVLGAGVWVLADPTRGTDLVELAATDEVRAEFGDGEGLAEAIGEGYQAQLDAGAPVLGTRTWVTVVGDVLDRPLGDVQLRSRTTGNLDLSEDPDTGEPRRLVTAVVRDREPAGCVVITRTDVTVLDDVCHRADDL